MSNIDFSQIVTAQHKAARAAETAMNAGRLECRRRIVEICGETAQINLAAAVGAGLLSEDDLAAYRAGLAWIAQMRTVWRALAEAGGDPTEDDNWPAVPKGFADLAAGF